MLSIAERKELQAAGYVAEYFVLVTVVGSNDVVFVSQPVSSIASAEQIYTDVVYTDAYDDLGIVFRDFDYVVSLYMRLGNVVEEIEYITL